jgi:hypothetical protein
MSSTQTYVTCLEQNFHTLYASVDGCRGALRLLREELLASDNSAQFHFEKSRQYYQMNLSLFEERDEMTRDIERLHNNAASTHADILQLNELNEILQKRIFELERLQDDQNVVSIYLLSVGANSSAKQENRNLRAKLAFLEAGNSGTRWPSPIRVKFPGEDVHRSSLSPESVRDPTVNDGELVNIVLDRGGFKSSDPRIC